MEVSGAGWDVFHGTGGIQGFSVALLDSGNLGGRRIGHWRSLRVASGILCVPLLAGCIPYCIPSAPRGLEAEERDSAFTHHDAAAVSIHDPNSRTHL